MKQLLVILLILMIATNPLAMAGDINQGEKIFTVECAGCHPNGGNIIRRGKNLRKKALHRYGMDSLDAIVNIVTNGKNNMSAFKERLTPEEINSVAGYVLKQADKGWQ